jgi:hypothetical protein
MQTKKDLSEDETFGGSYVPFLVNRSLSFHYDCILQANQMNMNAQLPNGMQYHYLLNTIRGYKRPYQKWQKRETIEDLEAVREYYNFSYEKAKEAIGLLSADQLLEIRKRLDHGGIEPKKRKA